MEPRGGERRGEALERAEKVLDEVSARREAGEIQRRMAKGYPAERERRVLHDVDAHLRRLDRAVAAISGVDEKLGLFFKIRYAEGHSFAQTCKYMQVGRTTLARYRRRLIEAIAARPDILRMLEMWAAGAFVPLVGRHRRPE